MQTYEVEAYLGDFAWEYDIDAIQREATDDMANDEFFDLCERHNLHKRAIKAINKAYKNDDFDAYERLLERWSKQLGISYNKLEDDCTDVRAWGYEAS